MNNEILFGYHSQRDFLNYLMLRFGKKYGEVNNDNKKLSCYTVKLDLQLFGIKSKSVNLIPKDFDKRVFKQLGIMIITNIKKDFKFINHIRDKKLLINKTQKNIYLYLDFVCDEDYKDSIWFAISDKNYLPYVQEFANYEYINKLKEKE